MELIEKFIKEYREEYDFYIKLAYITQDLTEEALKEAGIKSIVSSRAKKADSLREKIEKRNVKNKYENTEQIKDDIYDLAGVRIALYFPNERDDVDRIIREKFNVVKCKSFPEKNSSKRKRPKINRAEYWANHYRVYLKESDFSEKFRNTMIEIQVASVLMHSWAEIEHDLVYKPKNGRISWKEHKILSGVNALIIAGEIALEKLQKAIAERSSVKENRKREKEIKMLEAPDKPA